LSIGPGRDGGGNNLAAGEGDDATVGIGVALGNGGVVAAGDGDDATVGIGVVLGNGGVVATQDVSTSATRGATRSLRINNRFWTSAKSRLVNI
jgi:hypothetical protein